MTFRRPTPKAMTTTTLAEVLAAVERVAPMRFAMRVLAAMEMGKGIWKVRLVRVPRTDWAARWVVPK